LYQSPRPLHESKWEELTPADSNLEHVRRILAKVSPDTMSVSKDGKIVFIDASAAEAIRKLAQPAGTLEDSVNINLGPFNHC
jgi:hypothetical protein